MLLKLSTLFNHYLKTSVGKEFDCGQGYFRDQTLMRLGERR